MEHGAILKISFNIKREVFASLSMFKRYSIDHNSNQHEHYLKFYAMSDIDHLFHQ